jgi:glutathionylspermidine synthase
MIRAGCLLDEEAWRALRRRAIFDCHKWDPQVGDTAVVARFPLVISRAVWRELATQAEALAAETLAAEAELLDRAELHAALAIDRATRAALRRGGVVPGIARVMRFDFHPTAEGWRLSEVNSDVPGGYVEAGGIASLMAAASDGAGVVADPASELARAFAAALPAGATVALVHATAYADDRQAIECLAAAMRGVGFNPVPMAPDHLWWDGEGRAHGAVPWCSGPIDALFRFFPAEWLRNLPRSSGWQHFFRGSRTPQCNPGAALLVQSKRLPLVWDRLATPMPTWQRLLPETVAPAEARRRTDGGWILKPAMGRVGDGIAMAGVSTPRADRYAARWSRWCPGQWIAQRRFESVPVATSMGARHCCLGVYTIDGRAAGIYGRMAPRPLIDDRAEDVAVLVEDESAAPTGRAGGGVAA